MTPERLQQIRSVFEASLEQNASARMAFIEASSEGDHELRDHVLRLLMADAQEQGVIDQPALAAARTVAAPDVSGLEGRRIGPYLIQRQIGRGGMGMVYLATRVDVFHKQVAFKVLRPGSGGEEIIRRFRQEREILASLDHPNIARLLDGGATEEGLPYFVLEYVEGQPIDQYCDAHKLNVADRLRLFQKVCAVVQYAHQGLVVHRDLKPSNILVTAEGTVKLLDFGIAKLLRTVGDETAYQTQPGLRLMTPEYASPEQVKGENITTATDVYTLGVILYELLTGHRPYRIKSRLLHEVARIICEEEPTRPSTVISQIEEVDTGKNEPTTITPEQVSQVREGKPAKLKKRLAGDLDTILLMSLRKDSSRRYGSVAAFSEDLRRHLSGQPVQAQDDGIGYRLSKFFKRNQRPVAALVGLALSLLGGTAATLWQAYRARESAIEARIYRTLLSEAEEEVRLYPKDLRARERYLARFLEMGSVLEKQRDHRAALEVYRKAIPIAEQVLALDPRNRGYSSRLAHVLVQAGRMTEVLGDGLSTLAYYSAAADVNRRALLINAADAGSRQSLVTLLLILGIISNQMNEANLLTGHQYAKQATAYFQEALSQITAWPPADAPAYTSVITWSRQLYVLGGQYERAASVSYLSTTARLEYWEQALMLYERSLTLMIEAEKANPQLQLRREMPWERLDGKVQHCRQEIGKLQGSMERSR